MAGKVAALNRAMYYVAAFWSLPLRPTDWKTNAYTLYTKLHSMFILVCINKKVHLYWKDENKSNVSYFIFSEVFH
jgi:hypothetical protein